MRVAFAMLSALVLLPFASKANAADVTEFMLENGMEVVVIEDHLSLIHISEPTRPY